MSSRRISSVTVYCSSSNTVHADFFVAAREIGAGLAGTNRTMVYGGGRVGLMGEAARACRGAGGRVVGIITHTLKQAEQMDPDNHENVVVETMRERKRLLEHRGDAMIVLPGGLGTMEEFFEILVGRLLGEHNKPILMLNLADPNDPAVGSPRAGFYDPLLSMIDHMIQGKFAKAGAKELFEVCRTAAELIARLDQIEKAPVAAPDLRRLVPSA